MFRLSENEQEVKFHHHIVFLSLTLQMCTRMK